MKRWHWLLETDNNVTVLLEKLYLFIQFVIGILNTLKLIQKSKGMHNAVTIVLTTFSQDIFPKSVTFLLYFSVWYHDNWSKANLPNDSWSKSEGIHCRGWSHKTFLNEFCKLILMSLIPGINFIKLLAYNICLPSLSNLF